MTSDGGAGENKSFVKLPDGSIQYADGHIRKPSVEVQVVSVVEQRPLYPTPDGTLIYASDDGEPINGPVTVSKYVLSPPGYEDKYGPIHAAYDQSGHGFMQVKTEGGELTLSAPKGYDIPDLATFQARELVGGIEAGIAGIPGMLKDTGLMAVDGYRLMGDMATGQENSFTPYSPGTGMSVSQLEDGLYHNSFVGALGAMGDGNYDQAGVSLVGTAATIGMDPAIGYGKTLPVLGYDVGQGTKSGIEWMMDRSAPQTPANPNPLMPDEPFSIDGTGNGNIDSAPKTGRNYGVTFFGDDVVPFYGPSKATLGNPNGAPTFFMPLEDSGLVKDAHDAAVYTGMAPSAKNAYLNGGDVYGYTFPTDDLVVTKPTALDANGWPHYLEGGNTAVKLEGPNAGYMITPVREFVTPGNVPVPNGSVLFKLGPSGEWIPLKKW